MQFSGGCWGFAAGVARGWQPYSNGEWIYTRYGWTWVSYDPWGAIPTLRHVAFVGRYVGCGARNRLAPAWVTWSYSDRYVAGADAAEGDLRQRGYSGRPVVLNEAQYVFGRRTSSLARASRRCDGAQAKRGDLPTGEARDPIRGLRRHRKNVAVHWPPSARNGGKIETRRSAPRRPRPERSHRAVPQEGQVPSWRRRVTSRPRAPPGRSSHPTRRHQSRSASSSTQSRSNRSRRSRISKRSRSRSEVAATAAGAGEATDERSSRRKPQQAKPPQQQAKPAGGSTGRARTRRRRTSRARESRTDRPITARRDAI